MLVLTRKVGEKIIIDDNITVTVLSMDGQKVRIGVTAPPDISVHREEVQRRRSQFAEQPVEGDLVCAFS